MDTNVSFSPEAPVFVARLDDYDQDRMDKAVLDALSAVGVTREQLAGKRVAVKPNLVMKKDCDAAVTTHPALLRALLSFLDTCDCADVVIAESSGGPYTESALKSTYRVCGMEAAAEGHRAHLNYDVSSETVSAPDGKTSKNFEIITPIAKADVIFNLSKLKSHSLTRMSGAVKNTFGTIPGLTKFEFHARFSDYADFNSMIVDLSSLLHSRALTVDFCDAVVGMEGNGPTGGTPRKIGALLCSRNPFCLDRIGEALLACPHEVPMVVEAEKRGFCPASADEIKTTGDDWHPLIVSDFAAPDTARKHRNALQWLPTLFGGSLYRWFRPRPKIRKKTCIGCGECVRSCPVHTITLEKRKDGKKHALIHPGPCIRCFCCQELCPIHSVDIVKNPILAILAGLRR